ncbi:MAG: DUF2007 domain-containing protein [Bacteroidales bacterium]|nr:DUF2007 domain-containing protein [Bacteroidales bacterium]
MRTLKKYLNAMSANIDRSLLESEGIQAQVLHQNMPYAGISYKLAVELIVNDEDYDRALKILEEAAANQRELGDELPEED